MFLFYDVEVFPRHWIVVIKDGKKIHRIVNEKGVLMDALSSNKILVGFNNYRITDAILWAIIYDKDPFQMAVSIATGETNDFRFLKLPFLTLDASQETKKGLTLQEIQANVGAELQTDTADHTKPLRYEDTPSILERMVRNVETIEETFKHREDYFTTKFEIVETFKLGPEALKKSQAALAAEVLKAEKKGITNDRLNLTLDKKIPLQELPADVTKFYQHTRKRWIHGEDAEELEGLSYETYVNGVLHKYGFGGLHGALKNYIGNGNFMHIDAESFYPILMINNGFLSRAAASPELFKELFDTRMQLKNQAKPQEYLYKLIINKVFGASKAKFNKLYDPLQANNVAVNGQLILTHLLGVLNPFCELIQTNTDGIIVKYEHDMKPHILEVLDRFSTHYKISFKTQEIEKIAQRDVNNYAIRYKNGKIKAIGYMARYNGGNWEKNSLSVIDMAVTRFYLDGTPPSRTIIDLYKENVFAPFQIVAKKGNYAGLSFEDASGALFDLPDVCRVFATKKQDKRMIYLKTHDGKYTKFPDCPEYVYVHNESMEMFDKSAIDLNYYIKLAESKLFQEG